MRTVLALACVVCVAPRAAADHYGTLGVPRGASTQDIKSAFRKAALKHHPDKQREPSACGRAEEKFKAITEAYETLSDPQKRRVYDLQQSSPGPSGYPSSAGHGAFGGPSFRSGAFASGPHFGSAAFGGGGFGFPNAFERCTTATARGLPTAAAPTARERTLVPTACTALLCGRPHAAPPLTPHPPCIPIRPLRPRAGSELSHCRSISPRAQAGGAAPARVPRVLLLAG